MALDLSVKGYIRNLTRELESLGVESIVFAPQDGLPQDVNLYWDPRLTGGTPPWHGFLEAKRPLVATLYCAAPLGLPPWEKYDTVGEAVRGLKGMAKRFYEWHRVWRGRCAAIITISRFSQRQIENRLRLRGEKLVAIELGVDLETFKPPAVERARSHFLHVSQYQRRKNVQRIFAAYQRLEHPRKPPLVAVSPLYRGPDPGPGVELYDEAIPIEDVVALYQGALGLLFPSLQEGFGLPILEAMACGCPVITSTTTACPDTAGGAALLVNPRSVEELCGAMARLLDDPVLVEELTKKGFARARSLTWRLCAERHLAVFEDVMKLGLSSYPASP